MENEEIKNESLMVNERKNEIKSFSESINSSNVDITTITTIVDKKQLYNLTNGEDCAKLNDCVGEKLTIKDIVIRFYDKELEEVQVNEETGEIKEFERKVSCIVVDETGKAYATGSKSFAYQLKNFIEGGYITEQEIKENGLQIEIIKKQGQNTQNKVLGFKVL